MFLLNGTPRQCTSWTTSPAKLADSVLYRVVPTLLKKCRYVHPIQILKRINRQKLPTNTELVTDNIETTFQYEQSTTRRWQHALSFDISKIFYLTRRIAGVKRGRGRQSTDRRRNWRLECKNRYPIYDQNSWKPIPLKATHTYIAHIRKYPLRIWALEGIILPARYHRFSAVFKCSFVRNNISSDGTFQQGSISSPSPS